MNVEAERFLLNDLDKEIIGLHEFLCSYSDKDDLLFEKLFKIVDDYGLSCSYRRDEIPKELKENYKKTYFAQFNKESFGKLKSDFNRSHRNDELYLYILLIYGFNRMLRFNQKGEYNLPVGNVDFNKNTVDALKNYFSVVSRKRIRWSCNDYENFIKGIDFEKNDLVYLDPPYLITFSEYNKYWNEQTEKNLLTLLDELNKNHINFAISNVTQYKGRENKLFLDWENQYNVHPIKSNYISYHDNTVKEFNEVLVTNY